MVAFVFLNGIPSAKVPRVRPRGSVTLSGIRGETHDPQDGEVALFGGCAEGYKHEFLNGEIFYTLPEAAVLVEQWRRLYNTVRPHSALGGLPPAPGGHQTIALVPQDAPQLLGPPMAAGLT